MKLRYLSLALSAFAALAQTPANQKPATLEGTAFNSVTKEPLRKVELSLANGEMSEEMAAMLQRYKPGGAAEPEMPAPATKTLAATTDAAGKFRFENLPPGTYWLTAKKPGFGDLRYSPKTGGGGLTLTSGQQVTNVELRLVPHATLTGRVLDEDGEPYPTATVEALTYKVVFGHRRLTPVDMAQANNKGEFSLSKVPPGRYVLCADVLRIPFGAVPPPPADGSPETAYVGTYLPSSLDPAQAQLTDVAAGAELSGLTIRLRKSKVVRVRGKLTDASGQPITTAQIMLMGGGGRIGSMSMSMVNDPQGKFELTNVQPGTYNAMTIQMQGSTPKMSMQTMVVPDKSVDNFVLGSHADLSIQGSVIVDGDAKVALQGFAINLVASEAMGTMPASGHADQTGAFTVQHVTPAAYDLMLPHSPEGAYVKSVIFNDRESLGQVLDCSALTSATLRIVLGTDGGRVDVRVSSGDKPAPNATVVLTRSDPGRRSPQTVRQGQSDAAGRIALKDVPPGDYLAFAWDEVEDGAWFDPDFLKAATPVRVQVGPKASQAIELTLTAVPK